MIQSMLDGPAQRRLEQAAQSVFEQVSDGVLIVKAGGVVRSANPAAALMFGLPQNSLRGSDIRSFVPDWTERLMRDSLSQGDETVGRRGDGSSFPIRLSLRELTGDEDRSVIAVVTDLSEVRTLESRLHAAQKLEAIGLLTGGIAHDFNNLLMIVAGHCEKLRAQQTLTDAQRAGLEQIAVAADHAASLTTQLLALSRRSTAESGAIDLHAALTQTGRLLDRTLGEQMMVDMQLAAEPAFVRLNRSDVGQILINLAMNARDAMPAGGRFSIRTRLVALAEGDVSGAAAGRHVELTVSDTGAGMSAETRERAFEPFFTTKASDRGTGLGLSTVARIVKQSGGAIGLESAPGEGTRFTILLPVIPPGDAAPAALDQDASVPMGSETALVVEDDPAVREIVAAMLRGLGYRALEAAGLDDALSVLRDEARVDLLLSDVIMPDSSGPELAARLTQESPGLKVLFMSGYNEEPAGGGGAEPVESATIRKPFTRAALAQRVRAVLDRR
jgi:hypothetical protein